MQVPAATHPEAVQEEAAQTDPNPSLCCVCPSDLLMVIEKQLLSANV